MFDARFLSGRYLHISGMREPMSRYDLEESDDLQAMIGVLLQLAWDGKLHRDHYHFVIDKSANNRVVAAIVDFWIPGWIDDRTGLPARQVETVDIEVNPIGNYCDKRVYRYNRENPDRPYRIS